MKAVAIYTQKVEGLGCHGDKNGEDDYMMMQSFLLRRFLGGASGYFCCICLVRASNTSWMFQFFFAEVS